jgi:hypothetical protein
MFRLLPYAQHRIFSAFKMNARSSAGDRDIVALSAADCLDFLSVITRKPAASLLRERFNGGIICFMTTPLIRPFDASGTLARTPATHASMAMIPHTPLGFPLATQEASRIYPFRPRRSRADDGDMDGRALPALSGHRAARNR